MDVNQLPRITVERPFSFRPVLRKGCSREDRHDFAHKRRPRLAYPSSIKLQGTYLSGTLKVRVHLESEERLQ
jgi:hypothetical protein